jgi:putative ABC transport system permease protein
VSLLRLAWSYLAARPLLAALHVAMLALGVGTMVMLLLFTVQAQQRLERDARPVDLVVGAKGSPLQLILSSVLHVDVPTGNVPYAEARRIAAHPMVASATPISLGDSYRGYRIVGSDASFLALYGAQVGAGRMFARPMEAVVGAEVARRTGLAPGAAAVGSHGLAAGGGGSSHGAHPYRIVGVLQPTGTVIDRLVVTPLASVWEVHGSHAPQRAAAPGEAGHGTHSGESPGASEPPDGDITSLLVRYRTPLAAATLPRLVNSTTMMQAASPAYEMARLMNLVGVGIDALRVFAVVLMATAAVSMLATLMSALQERRYDLALLRTLGARPATLFALLAAEGVTLVVAGVILGLALGHAATEALGTWIARTGSWSISGWAWDPLEGWIIGAVLGAGLMTCLLPAIQAYRRDPAILLKR